MAGVPSSCSGVKLSVSVTLRKTIVFMAWTPEDWVESNQRERAREKVPPSVCPHLWPTPKPYGHGIDSAAQMKTNLNQDGTCSS